MWKKTLLAAALLTGLSGQAVAETTDGQTKELQSQLSSAQAEISKLQTALNDAMQTNADLKTELKTIKADHPDLERAKQQSRHFQMIRDQLEKLNIEAFNINRSPVPGLYEVSSSAGLIYSSPTATHLMFGTLYKSDQSSVINLSDQSLAVIRKERLGEFEKDMIVYPAKDEKHVITVFTDTDCGYCRKLHREMKDYNDLGITVRYLAFPRGGEQSKTYRDMVSIWCAEDQREAMDIAKNGKSIDSKTCENTVLAQYQLGGAFGVNGTPAIVLQDGSLQPGYVPAERLKMLLDSQKVQ